SSPLLGLVVALGASAQNQPAPAPQQSPAQTAPAKPSNGTQTQNNSSNEAKPAPKVDHAASYYHFGLAHMYEEMLSMYGRSEYASKAIDEYKLAIAADPSSEYLNAALADLYTRTGRIRDAVLEAQEMLGRDPNNLEAHKLLGRIYLRSLSDPQSGGSPEVLKLAIEQYEAIIRIEPTNAENFMMLGRLYALNKDLLRAENMFKAAQRIDPESEDAASFLASLYNDEGDSKKALDTLNALPEAAR